MTCAAPRSNCCLRVCVCDLSPAVWLLPGLRLLQRSIKGLILLQVTHNRQWLQIRLRRRWLGISGTNSQTVLLERLSLQPGNHFFFLFFAVSPVLGKKKATTMASDLAVCACVCVWVNDMGCVTMWGRTQINRNLQERKKTQQHTACVLQTTLCQGEMVSNKRDHHNNVSHQTRRCDGLCGSVSCLALLWNEFDANNKGLSNHNLLR